MKELTFPRVMMVSDEPITKENPGVKRVVWAYNPKFHYPFFAYSPNIKTLKDVDITSERETVQGWDWKYAQELQQEIELTLDEIAEKFEIPVEQLKIKK